MTFYKLEHIPVVKLEIQIKLRLFSIVCKSISYLIVRNRHIRDFKRVLSVL